MNKTAPYLMLLLSISTAASCLTAARVLGQTAPVNPTQQQIQPPLPIVPPLPPQPTEPLVTPPAPSPPPALPSQPQIPVAKINVVGSTIFGPAQFDPITAPLLNRTVSLQELQGAADAITQLYLDGGYLTSRAVLGEQTIAGGVVTIRVIEGRLEEISVTGNEGLLKTYITSRIQLGAGVPLNGNALEEQLRLLKVDPLFKNVSASLQPGTTEGASILAVRVDQARRPNGLLGMDTNTPPAIAPERGFLNFSYQNLSGVGDTIYGSYAVGVNLGEFDWGASNTYEFGYSIPVNALNGTFSIRTVQGDSRITQAVGQDLGIRSTSNVYQINFRQPIIRSIRQELALSVGFTQQSGQTFLFNNTPFPFGIGPDANGYSRTSVVDFSQDYVHRDNSGAWVLRSQLNFGLPIFDATDNPGAIPSGQFFSWLAQGQRVQQLWDDNFVILRSSLQLSPNNLLAFNQFVIGGETSVRGYATNARSGDNGFQFSTEGRFPIIRNADNAPMLQLVPLLDFGIVWNNPSNPNGPVANNVLLGSGLGLIYQPTPAVDIKFGYAVPVFNVPGQGSSLQSDGFYFSIVGRP
ncbi:ShlB/FhaC/HecB family hemolysin secretion/activation protein [Thermosynechococcaceae cyanobacterium BACA0444]|uniref:ShlB/FhaC/HecB family hemolysin secretion/activation protein n=1 Tax=Pseudocalidococcus azoricus BACA0444 TaxID=2918990 RepID=A0AAE4JZP3_9CYAN|nr:ShlB/FhaC/HecB family hemolysin secretion/activation protein [Pseudocalidococcus azoricus]MDS3862364.1 ShlB/FhaC/HecB family hemolysin secretion/activation protein [Pseudocalidococcus azoricus BACA0444]